MSKVVLFCIAKLEHRYIEEFCKYQLSIGFDTIYIFDNEDVPTYQTLLQHIPNIYVIHFPGKVMQYHAIQYFINNIMYNHDISHVIHMDVDEFIVLKKHKSIKDFIQEYIKDDCAGIGINWRFFGDSNKKTYSNEPLRSRFTWCQKNGDQHYKQKIKEKYNIFITNSSIGHTSITFTTNKQVLDAISEFYLLSNSEIIINASKSGFSIMASKFKNIPILYI